MGSQCAVLRAAADTHRLSASASLVHLVLRSSKKSETNRDEKWKTVC